MESKDLIKGWKLGHTAIVIAGVATLIALAVAALAWPTADGQLQAPVRVWIGSAATWVLMLAGAVTATAGVVDLGLRLLSERGEAVGKLVTSRLVLVLIGVLLIRPHWTPIFAAVILALGLMLSPWLESRAGRQVSAASDTP
ncbi:MAG: hypothetical protein ACLFV3_02430 [Phycisphaeraceae bacterium]